MFSRSILTENSIRCHDLIWPVFVTEGQNIIEPIDGLSGVDRISLDILGQRAKAAHRLGIPAIAIFPRIDPARKDADGTNALANDNLVCRAIAAIKSAEPDMGVIVDIALDPFTTHGHDGLIRDGVVDNDASLGYPDQTGHQLCPKRRGYCRAIRYDGWPRWCYSGRT
jgi:porphobilinogen synthase